MLQVCLFIVIHQHREHQLQNALKFKCPMFHNSDILHASQSVMNIPHAQDNSHFAHNEQQEHKKAHTVL